MKLGLLTTLVVGLCTILTVLAVSIPAAWVSKKALVTAREEQLEEASRHVSELVSGFFVAPSKYLSSLKSKFEASLQRNNENPLSEFVQKYGDSVWHDLVAHPTISSIALVLKRDPKHVIVGGCDLDTLIIARPYMSLLTPETNGNISSCPEGTFRACNGTLRLSTISGEPTDPLQPVTKLFDIPCRNWVLGNHKALWLRPVWLGDMPPTDTFPGLSYQQWSRTYPTVGGSFPNQAIFHGAVAPIVGPPSRPHALALVTVRLSDSHVTGGSSMDEISLNNLLADAARFGGRSLSTTLFILSFKKRVLATSIPNFSTEIKDEEGKLQGNYLYNDSSLPKSIREVASIIATNPLICRLGKFDAHDGEIPCDFTTVPRFMRIGGFLVSFSVVEDPAAKHLHLLLCNLYEDSVVNQPATELQFSLALISCSSLLVSCIAAFLIGSRFAIPIRDVSKMLSSAALLQDLETLQSEIKTSHFVTEYQDINDALLSLVAQLIEYRTMLPAATLILKDRPMNLVSDDKPSHNTVSDHDEGSVCTFTGVSDGAQLQRIGIPSEVSDRTTVRLSCRNITILLINLRHWHHGLYGQASNKQLSQSLAVKVTASCREYLSIIHQCKGKGTIDRFNGDQAVISWNSSATVRLHNEAAMACSVGLRESHVALSKIFLFEKAMGIGICSGRAYCGIAGCDASRAFNVIGQPVSDAWILCKAACRVAFPGKPAIVLTDSKKILNSTLLFVGSIYDKDKDKTVMAWELLRLEESELVDIGKGEIPDMINMSLHSYLNKGKSFEEIRDALRCLSQVIGAYPDSHAFALSQASTSEEDFRKAFFK